MFSRHLECELALNQLHFFFSTETSYVNFFCFCFRNYYYYLGGGGGGGRSFLRVYVTFVFVVCLFVFVVVVFLSCLLRICLLNCNFRCFSIL